MRGNRKRERERERESEKISLASQPYRMSEWYWYLLMTRQSYTASCSNMFSSFADKKDPNVKNVMHYNNLIECLDLHLTEIDLIDYRRSTSEIKLAKFFVLEASVLKDMRFGVLWRNNEWRDDQHKRLRLNDKVSAEAEFVFETSSGQRLENLFSH